MSEEEQNNHYSAAAHQQLQRSATIDRRSLIRPSILVEQEAPQEAASTHQAEPAAAVTPESAKISSFAKCQAENLRRRQMLAEKINQERLAAMRRHQLERVSSMPNDEQPASDCFSTNEPSRGSEFTTAARPAQSTITSQKGSSAGQGVPRPNREADYFEAARQKDAAIKKAMHSVATMAAEDKKSRRGSVKSLKLVPHKRLFLAIFSAIAVVAAIGYFVSVNLPDVSMQVTALSSGISKPYPSYVPRDFSLTTSLTGENSVSMTFASGDKFFTLHEEKSTWDSKALLNNYVELNWQSYDTVKEQGLTIYISGSKAAWVNGGVKYIIEADYGVLTNKQIKNIATSL